MSLSEMARRQYWRGWRDGFVFACTLCLVLTVFPGCQTPEAVRRLEAESVASIEAYHSNAEAAIEALKGAYREASYRELDLTAEIALVEEAEQRGGGLDHAAEAAAFARLRDDLETAETEADRQAAEARYRAAVAEAMQPPEVVLRPDVALAAVRKSVERAQQIEAEVDRFSARWEAAGADYADALRLRARLKDYLEAGGVQPEQIETLAEALAREIERRRD